MNKVLNLMLAASLIGLSHQVSAITINIDYTYDDNNFFSDTGRRNVLRSAADFFENSINDSLDAITIQAGSQFNARFNRPDNNVLTTLQNFTVAADTIIVYAGGRDIGNSLGLGGPGGFSGSGFQPFFDRVLSRGEGNGSEGAVRGSTATDFAPWGGAIAFNTSINNWYVDRDLTRDDVPAGQIDFYSVALHEFGHVLGMGTADSWDNLVASNEFIGSASKAANGGANVALDSALVHWQDGTTSDGQETAMDPIIFTGDRKRFTRLDLAGLSDVGWEVTAVPVPSTVLLFASGLIGLVGLGRKNAKK